VDFLPTIIIPKYPQVEIRKEAVGEVPPSILTITYDAEIPGGTVARAEMSFDGLFQPHIFLLESDPEVKGEVYVQLDTAEKKILEIDENSALDVDVDEAFGELLTTKLILQAVTKTTTTSLRKISLKYTGGIYEYRTYKYSVG
jgi:hypothetical protein